MISSAPDTALLESCLIIGQLPEVHYYTDQSFYIKLTSVLATRSSRLVQMCVLYVHARTPN